MTNAAAIDIWSVAYALWLGITVIAVIGAAWLVAALTRADARVRRSLEDRLARGELDFEEYQVRIALLGGN